MLPRSRVRRPAAPRRSRPGRRPPRAPRAPRRARSALIGCSIFIASSTTSVWPARDAVAHRDAQVDHLARHARDEPARGGLASGNDEARHDREVDVAARAAHEHAVAVLRDARARAAPVDLRVDRVRGPRVDARVHAVAEPEAPVAQRAIGDGDLAAADARTRRAGRACARCASRSGSTRARRLGAVAPLEPERRELRGALELFAGRARARAAARRAR